MKIYLSPIGYEAYSVANNIWLAEKIHKFKADKVILIYNENRTVLKNLESNKEKLEGYEIHEYKCNDTTESFTETLKQILKEHPGTYAVDLTPGRKYMSIILASLALKHAKHAFYAQIQDTERYKKKPISQIPIVKIDFQDLKEYLK